jgi:hypothetical protein
MTPDRATIATPGVRAARPTGQRPLPSAQRLWNCATKVSAPLDRHDALAVVLELLREARHEVAPVSHALTLGRSHARAHPSDPGAKRGVLMLEQALTFLGVEPRAGHR